MNHLINSLFGPSLASNALVQIAIRVALVIAIMTAIAYYHVVNAVKEQSLGQLEKYIIERTQRESNIFHLAKDNHAILKRELLQRLEILGDSDPVEAFNRKIKRFPDGTMRTRMQGFDGAQEPFVFIGRNVNIDADLRRRVMTFLQLSSEYGPPWHHRLQNVYFTAPENLLAGYWPEVPDWAHSLPADIYIPDEEYVWVADKEHNPSRESIWTGLFYDIGGQTWMVSLETPVDIGDQQIATIGHDITLNELMDRTIGNHLEGAYNMIIRRDGRLIAHPQKMDLIKEKEGYFDVNTTNDVHLNSIYKTLLNMQPEQTVIENIEYDEYLAVGLLEEPNWYFVTVYPHSLITTPAYHTARIILLLGFLSLVVELIIFYLILTRNVSRPLNDFSHAVKQVSEGKLNVLLNTQRDDELGALGRTFNHMTKSLNIRNKQREKAEAELNKYRHHLEDLVEERTRELKDTQEELMRKERLATLGQLTATVSHELRNPLGAMRPSLYVIHKKSDEKDTRVQKAIERVERNINRCDHIIDELLDFTRITELNKSPIHLDEWLDMIIEELDIPKDIKIEKEFTLKDVELTVDTHRLRRAIINVVENACHAMLEDEQQKIARKNSRLVIRTRKHNKRIEIEITDTGSGIPEEILEKIFEPLYSTKGFGVGLGMPTVKQIMEQHNGGIEIESDVGKKTKVILWLPILATGEKNKKVVVA